MHFGRAARMRSACPRRCWLRACWDSVRWDTPAVFRLASRQQLVFHLRFAGSGGLCGDGGPRRFWVCCRAGCHLNGCAISADDADFGAADSPKRSRTLALCECSFHLHDQLGGHDARLRTYSRITAYGLFHRIWNDLLGGEYPCYAARLFGGGPCSHASHNRTGHAQPIVFPAEFHRSTGPSKSPCATDRRIVWAHCVRLGPGLEHSDLWAHRRHGRFFLDLALGQEKPVQANSDSNEMGARDGNTL